MLQFGPQRQKNLVLHSRELILNEPVEELQVPAGGQECKQGAVGNPVRHEPVSTAPDESIASAGHKPILKIDVKSVEILGESIRYSPPGSVPVNLQGGVRRFRYCMGPSA